MRKDFLNSVRLEVELAEEIAYVVEDAAQVLHKKASSQKVVVCFAHLTTDGVESSCSFVKLIFDTQIVNQSRM